MPTSVFPVDISTGILTINSVSLNTYAWCCLDLRALYMPTDYRTGNVVIPGAHGRRPYAYWIDETTHDLPMFITGQVDLAGTPHADPWVGYQTNIAYLTSHLLVPPTAPTATYSASITMPSGSTKSADVQVLGLQFQAFDLNARFFQRAALTIRIPAGRFV